MHPHNALAYRPDVDGLRALAVLSVIAFHAAPHTVEGGFVGVDIFFVISGYLISGIILQNLQRGTFSFTDFYARRIKRIFPALLLMLTAVAAFGWFVLFPDEHDEVSKHIAGGAGFVSNIVLWREAGYFARNADLKPLLHLWSLGIEEQFYFLWPLFLYCGYQLRLKLLPWIVAGTLISFGLNILRIAASPETTFYLPPTRFWELLIGGTLAHAQIFHRAALEKNLQRIFFTRDAQAACGLLLIVASLLLVNRHLLFPGWWALLPTVGAFLLIAAGPDAWINQKILGNRTAVAIGLISYPLYLWHWPLLAFMHILYPGKAPPALIAGAVAMAFVLATLTYRFIELPIRKIPATPRLAIPLAASVALIGAVGYLGFIHVLTPRSMAYGVARFTQPSEEKAFTGPHLENIATESGRLMVQRGDVTKQIMFMGDSHMEQYYPRIDELIGSERVTTYSAAFATLPGCIPIVGVKENYHPRCGAEVDLAIQYAQRPEVEAIVISSNWYGYFVDPIDHYSYYFQDQEYSGSLLLGTEGYERALASLQRMIGQFVSSGKKVYLLLQIPVGDAMDPRHMVERDLRGLNFQANIPRIEKAPLIAAYAPLVSRLKQIGQETGAILIDPMEELCSADTCPVVTPTGEPTYRDPGHLRPSWVRSHVRYLDDIVLLEGGDMKMHTG